MGSAQKGDAWPAVGKGLPECNGSPRAASLASGIPVLSLFFFSASTGRLGEDEYHMTKVVVTDYISDDPPPILGLRRQRGGNCHYYMRKKKKKDD